MRNDVITLDQRDFVEIKKYEVLFICTGNTCRSPMCAALYNDRYAGMTSRAFSRGIAADGSPISENAVLALRDFGIRSVEDNDYEAHISRNVTHDDLERADVVICVSSSHLMNLIFRFPSFASKMTSFPHPISDPFGGNLDEYKRCLSDIEKSLSEMFSGNNYG